MFVLPGRYQLYSQTIVEEYILKSSIISILIVINRLYDANKFLGYNAGTEMISSEQCGTDEGGKTTNGSDNNKIKIKYKYDKNELY